MGEMRSVNKKIHNKVKRVNLMGDSCIFESEHGEIYSFGKNNSGELG